jgi:FkbM family methyltransferase
MTTGGEGGRQLAGRLIGSSTVVLHPETVRYASPWNTTASGMASLEAEDASLVRVFHDLCSQYAEPFVIDVGAHVGTFSLVGALQGGMRGCSFEPHPAVCDILRTNLALNGMASRFSVHQEALSNYPGRRILKSPYKDKESGLSCIGQPNYKNYKENYVDVVRLDDFVASSDINSVDIINIDTEGCELLALIGASETITRYKPDILIKVNWSTLIQFSVYANNLTDYLDLIGYHGYWVGPEEMVFKHPYKKTGNTKKHFVDKPEIGGLKVAIVKQQYDLFGPWRSETWNAADPLSILKKWPSRYLYFEMTHLLQADWYILPFCHDSKIVRQKIDAHQQLFDDHMEHVRRIGDIPVNDYDVVITLDPILRPPLNSATLFAYHQNEHHHDEYKRSVKAPLPGYDLFLDHMMNAPDWAYDLPQAVAFPYVRHPLISRTICRGQQEDAIWFDKRFIMMLTHGNESYHRPGFEHTMASLEQRFGMRATFRNADYENIIDWGDPYNYMRDMSACKYYINLIACGAGQGLCDAASLGLICFGSPKLPYHRAICHPVCLCRDLAELERKLPLVHGSAGLQQEIIAWQDTALSDRMVNQPLRILQAAAEKKRKLRQSAITIGRTASLPMDIELTVEDLSPSVGRINSEKLKLRALAEYEKGNYGEAIHGCKQALWFDESDNELYYIIALAYYAAMDMKNAQLNLTESLKINDKYRPAITLNTVLKYEGNNPDEETRYSYCSSRVAYLIYHNFINYDKHIDYANIELYNLILDEMMKKYIELEDLETYVSTQHYKQRLNKIAGLP